MPNHLSRRDFLSGAAGLCALAPLRMNPFQTGDPELLPRRKRIPNPFLENDKPVVVVVKGNDYAAMLAKGMDMLGGFSAFGKNRSIHLNPNFVAPTPYPVTTDGQSLVDTVRLLQKEGYTDITIAEWGSLGRGNSVNPTRAFAAYGLDSKAGEGGFKIKDLYNDDVVRVTDTRWKAMPNVGVFRSVYETGLIIDMPTLKQHSMLQFTCALKNVMGQVDSRSRLDMHREGPAYASEDKETQLRMAHYACAEIAAAVDPELTIIDARQAIGKSHHFRSGGVALYPGCVIISGDALAADWTAARILEDHYDGFSLDMARPHLDHACTLGFGCTHPDDMVVKRAEV